MIGLLNLAEELGNVAKAWKSDTFYPYQEATNDGGIESLLDQNRRLPKLKNRVDPAIEASIVAYATDEPAHGQVRVSNELCTKSRRFMSHPAGCAQSGYAMDWQASKNVSRRLRRRLAE